MVILPPQQQIADALVITAIQLEKHSYGTLKQLFLYDEPFF
jgi:hypothetical protein